MASRPNILLILIDDLGARDLGCYGSTFYETPHLDALAAEGMTFSRAYASAPVCSPTRASILSGKYPARIGLTQYIAGRNEGRLLDVPYLHYLPLEETTIATALRQGGYQTWHVGKWHLGDEQFQPQHHGFDVNIAGSHLGLPPTFFSPYRMPMLNDGPAGEYLTDRLTDEALALIRRRDRKRPFFLNLWHYAVHIPIQAPAALIEKYRRKAAALGLDRLPAIVDGEEMPRLPAPGRQPERIRRRLVQSDPHYAAMIENLDWNIGRLLAALQQEGLTGDTLVIFTSDNGGLSTSEGSPTSNLPLAEGKGWSREGGTRVCQLVRWPGVIPADSRCDVPVTSTDFYPTILEAAALPLRPQQHPDGISLMPLLRGGAAPRRQAIYWHFPHYSNQGDAPSGSVIEGNWKLIEHFEDQRLELFDLSQDISETRDLSRAQPDRAARLHGMLKAWRTEVAARMPSPNPDYERRRPRVSNNATQ